MQDNDFKKIYKQNKLYNKLNRENNIIKRRKNMRKENKRKKDNTTIYGEEVCSEFAWLPLDKQKEKANKLNEITKNKEK